MGDSAMARNDTPWEREQLGIARMREECCRDKGSLSQRSGAQRHALGARAIGHRTHERRMLS